MAKKKMIGGSWRSRIFSGINAFILILITLITFYPLYYVAITSISNGMLVMQGKVNLYPIGLTLDSYRSIMSDPQLFQSLWNSIVYTIVGTIINLVMSCLCAFPLSRRTFSGKRFFTGMIVFTMFFGGGMIPLYLVIKDLHMMDTIWAIVLPVAINTYNMIIMKNNFESIPDSLEESARMDGANDIVILFKIVLPLSKAILAVMVLMYGVSHWNAWFDAMLFIRKRDLYPLQIILREILIANSTDSMMAGSGMSSDVEAIGESIKYATIVVATAPILCVYPFIQKYFTKGVMLGAVKG